MTQTRSLMFFTTARSWAMKIMRQAVAGLQVLEQVEHLGLHAHVEGRHRLVADDQLRVEHEGAGDADALALAARELVGPAVGGHRRVDADVLEHLAPTLASRSALVPTLQILSGSMHDVADLAARVQRRDRVLEDHLHVRAQLAHRLALQRR